MAIPREQLYKEVWSEPMTKVAARYGVSSSFLARVCERLRVPRPARGYWAKLAVGKASDQPPLPDARPGEEIKWSRHNEPRRVAPCRPEPPQRRRRARRQASSQPEVHELIVGARTHFDAAKVSDAGYLRPSKRLLVDIFVSEGFLSRALETANAIFREIESCGYGVSFAPVGGTFIRSPIDKATKGWPGEYYHGHWSPCRPTLAFIGTVAFGLCLFELAEEVEVAYVNGSYVPMAELRAPKRRNADIGWTTKRHVPTGRLCLRAYSPYPQADWEYLWSEQDTRPLIEIAPRIVSKLEREAATIANLVEEGNRRAEIERLEWEEQCRQWEEEERERRRQQNIEESRKELAEIIDAWGTATRTEQFFQDAERRAADLSDNEKAVIVERLQEARSLLGGINALERLSEWKPPSERDA